MILALRGVLKPTWPPAGIPEDAVQLDEYLRSAAGDLVRHKMRTLLTMLGIIFGVGAVISMLSIGAGAQAESLKLIDSMGLRNVIVRDRPVDDQDLYTLREKSLGLSLRDLEGLRQVSPDFIVASARKRIKSSQVISEYGRSSAQVLGVTLSYFNLYNLSLEHGSFFDTLEERSFSRVCLLGSRAQQDLFAYLDPVGEAVKVNDVWFTVVGVLHDQNLAADSFEGVDLESANNSIFMPITTALKMFDRPRLASEVDELVLQVAPGASIETNTALLGTVLRDLHGGEADFILVVPEKLLEQSSRTRRIFNVVMGGIAGISLLVGGIGIMNIMLASVLERTREIGIRRAVGARPRDILNQFLAEAVVISGLGGFLGVLLGFSIASGVAFFSQWTTLVTGFSIVLAFGFSLLVGLVFGTYPALNAARLNPIDALRYE
ncbi:MAG: ABC transporter permease [Acidobacteria bacterium]|nr:ABC transporter permease [Acidobacteriota bacterium]